MIDLKQREYKVINTMGVKNVWKQTANELTKNILTFLHAKGCFAYRSNNAAIYDPVKKVFRSNSTLKGVFDITGVMPKTGQAIFIEIKAGRDKISPDQEQFMNNVIKNGGIAIVARSLDDVIKIFKN